MVMTLWTKTKRIMMLLGVFLAFSAVVLAATSAHLMAADLTSSYEQIKGDYPEFVNRLISGGATETDIENFLIALDAKVKEEGQLNEANFNKVMLESVKELLTMRKHRPILQSLLNEFSAELDYALNGKLHPGLVPLRNAVMKAVLDSEEDDASNQQTLSSETALKSLQVSSGVLTPSFNAERTSYTVTLPSDNTVIPAVTAEALHSKATVLITAATSLPGMTTVKVTAENGLVTRTYTIQFLADVSDNADKTLNTNARLQSLIVDSGVLSPPFTADHTEYTLVLPAGTTRIPVVSAKAENPLAAVVIEQANTLPGSALVKVTSEDKQNTKTYRIDMDVADPVKPASQPVGRVEGAVEAEVKRQLNQGRASIELKLEPRLNAISLSGSILREITSAGKDLEIIIGKVVFRLLPGTITIDTDRTLSFSASPLSAAKSVVPLQYL